MEKESLKYWTDVYIIPFKERDGRVTDAKDQFVCTIWVNSLPIRKKIVGIINKDIKSDFNVVFSYDGEHIGGINPLIGQRNNLIQIRGWGNLTGVGGHNMSFEDAKNVQDTFAEYIVNQLNKHEELSTKTASD